MTEATGRGLSYGQPNLVHDISFLLIRDTCRVDAIGNAILRPCRLMPHYTGCEMLRDTSSFALGDEPLAR